MEKTALLIIDAQQEYFAPVGKVVLPDGPKAVIDGGVIPHDQVHRTYLASLNGFLVQVTNSDAPTSK